MAINTIPIFVVSSGRSGSQMIQKALSAEQNIEIHHEFLCTHVQPLSAQYYMGLIDKKTTINVLVSLYGSALYYCQKKYWCDSSNKISWLIRPLYEAFPESRFVHLVRDGRKVVSSFFHKLKGEIYDDYSVSILQNWINQREKLPTPPPEKKYWWNIPQTGQPFADEFPSFNQFERICYHWVEINRVILSSLDVIPCKQKRFVRLEELVSDTNVLQELLAFLRIKYNHKFVEMLKRPHNVNIPQDFLLSDTERKQFERIAGGMMERLGYRNATEYRVSY